MVTKWNEYYILTALSGEFEGLRDLAAGKFAEVVHDRLLGELHVLLAGLHAIQQKNVITVGIVRPILMAAASCTAMISYLVSSWTNDLNLLSS